MCWYRLYYKFIAFSVLLTREFKRDYKFLSQYPYIQFVIISKERDKEYLAEKKREKGREYSK